MINGVLVKRTIDDVLPQLTGNAEGLTKILDDLIKQYKTKEDAMGKWKVRWPVNVGSTMMKMANE